MGATPLDCSTPSPPLIYHGWGPTGKDRLRALKQIPPSADEGVLFLCTPRTYGPTVSEPDRQGGAKFQAWQASDPALRSLIEMVQYSPVLTRDFARRFVGLFPLQSARHGPLAHNAQVHSGALVAIQLLLAALQAAVPDNQKVQLHVAGHSAGSISAILFALALDRWPETMGTAPEIAKLLLVAPGMAPSVLASALDLSRKHDFELRIITHPKDKYCPTTAKQSDLTQFPELTLVGAPGIADKWLSHGNFHATDVMLHAFLTQSPPQSLQVGVDTTNDALARRAAGLLLAAMALPMANLYAARGELSDPRSPIYRGEDSSTHLDHMGFLEAIFGSIHAVGPVTFADAVATGDLRQLQLWADHLIRLTPDQALGGNKDSLRQALQILLAHANPLEMPALFLFVLPEILQALSTIAWATCRGPSGVTLATGYTAPRTAGYDPRDQYGPDPMPVAPLNLRGAFHVLGSAGPYSVLHVNLATMSDDPAREEMGDLVLHGGP